MVFDGRYIANEPTFKRHAYAALKSRFRDEAAFEDFYASLDTPQLKDEFLHVATFYLFLVKQGEWHVTVEGSAPVVDYFSTSFKVGALFALIESLSDETHQDFYEWLCSRDPETTFPIRDLAALTKLYEDYKESYGSIRRCVAFFSRLSPERQQALCRSIKKDKKPLHPSRRSQSFCMSYAASSYTKRASCSLWSVLRRYQWRERRLSRLIYRSKLCSILLRKVS